MTEFKDLWISKKTLDALTKKWFTTPSLIQEKVIPLLLKGEINVIGQAATGTGKTAAFGIPLIEKFTPGKNVQALILAPTRELAIQIAAEINSIQWDKKLNVVAMYGKQSYDIQIRALKRWVDILVGTPGRIMDHLKRKTLDLSHLSYFILDEADEMLDMGFVDDIETIFKQTKPEKKVLLFSATMSKSILKIAKKYIGEYELIETPNTEITGEQTDQTYFEVQERDKFELLRRIMDTESEFYGIVFCHTKADVDQLVSRLNDEGYSAEGLHGDLAQKQREHFLKRFKDKKVNVLVATDIAARGIDVNDVTHVINYAIPQNAERYTHRIGRTGRAWKTGIAITFITPREYSKMSYLRKVNKVDIKKWEIPNIKWIIEKKKEKLKENIEGVVTKESHKNYKEIADKLIENMDPRDVVAALLKMHYENDFDQTKYRDIVEQTRENRFGSRWGQTRLFIALGRKEGYTAPSLLDLISEESWVASRDMDELKMMDDFSFISVSSDNAEIITRAFANKIIQGKKWIVNKAKDSRWGDRGGSRWGERWPRKNYRESGSSGRSFSSRGSERWPRKDNRESRPTRNFGERPPYQKKEFWDKKPFWERKSFSERKPSRDKKPSWRSSTNDRKKSFR